MNIKQYKNYEKRIDRPRNMKNFKHMNQQKPLTNKKPSQKIGGGGSETQYD